jgi:hypothetical protein
MRGHWLRIATVLALMAAGPASASDHADPAWLSNGQQEANLTGLFFFPKGDRYVAILDTRATLTAAPPYNLKPYAFTINIDTHSDVVFPAPDAATAGTVCAADTQAAPGEAVAPAQPYGTPAPNAGPARPRRPAGAELQKLDGDCARYGGTVVHPEGIRPDVSFGFALEPDATLLPQNLHITGLRPGVRAFIFNDASLSQLQAAPARYADAVLVYTGVRDDPFIFPKFFNANVITMVVSVPKSAFPTTSPNWLLWASSNWAKSGKQIDHVGRSNRTQLGRFDVLNTQPPNRHVRILRDVTAARIKVQDFLKEVLRPVSNLNQLSGFLLRNYDYAPDVMIYSSLHPARFPNGRQLEDDVAKITCENGDCPLQENSYIDSAAYPRAVKNDKAFLTDFPYLAAPWPDRPQPFTGSPWHWFRTHLLWPLVLIVIAVIAFRWWRRRTCARLRAAMSAQPGETP